MDDRIIHLAEAQHGIVGRRQLLAAGLSPRTLDSLLARGAVRRVSRGVYRVAGAPLTPIGELLAATIRCGPSAVVAGERLLAITGLRTARSEGPFVVLTRPGRFVTGVSWQWRPDPFAGRHGAAVAGVPSVTPARSLLEAAVDATGEALERLVDGARWQGRLLRATRALALEFPLHPGSRRLAASGLIDAAGPESPPERRLAACLAGLGGQPQAWVSPRVRVDLLFASAGLVVEYDGEAAHGGPEARARDRRRDAALHSLGYAVLRLTSEELRRPREVRERVEGLLAVLGSTP